MKVIFLFCYLALFTSQAWAEDLDKLTVTGSATIYRPPDTLNLTVGVESYGPKVKQVIQDNSEKMRAVKAALVKAGLTDKEIQTKQYSITPQMTPAPKNPPENWQPLIAGYRVYNTLDIRTQKILLAGDIIDAVAKEGSNVIENVSFDIQADEPSKSEAIVMAFHNANTYAKTVAAAAGIKLNKIHELSVNQLYLNPQPLHVNRQFLEAATPITPRDVEVNASVTVVYEIKSQ